MRSGHGCNLAALQYIEPLRGFLSELLSMLSSLMMPADWAHWRSFKIGWRVSRPREQWITLNGLIWRLSKGKQELWEGNVGPPDTGCRMAYGCGARLLSLGFKMGPQISCCTLRRAPDKLASIWYDTSYMTTPGHCCFNNTLIIDSICITNKPTRSKDSTDSPSGTVRLFQKAGSQINPALG